MHPQVMNQNMSPLQSRNSLPATTLLTDPAGGGTTYSIDGVTTTFGNEHKFADRGLIPMIEDRLRATNPDAHPRDIAVEAGREARWRMTGDPGPDPVPRRPAGGGRLGMGVTAVGTALAAYSLYQDYRHGDWAMGVGDALMTAGGGLELYGLATGATVAGVSAVSAGVVLGGVGLAAASGVYGYRAYQAGDTAGVVAGVVGVAAGAALVAGVVFGAPLVLAAGAVAAVGVGLFHLYRWLSN
jgi:hypothetical protein